MNLQMESAQLANIRIQVVPLKSGLLEKVVEMWRPESRWLGFFPQGAFEEYANRGGIIAALCDKGNLVGYIAVRCSGGWFHITHLCVASSHRQKSVARQLIAHVLELSRERQLLGLRLKCRSDFPADRFWPRAGFHTRSASAGKQRSCPSELKLWVRRNPDVQDLFFQSQDTTRRLAVIDANVFFDFAYESKPETAPSQSIESLYLCSGWVQDAVEFCVVDELHTEILRNNSIPERQAQIARASNYRELEYDHDTLGQIVKALEALLGWTGRQKIQRESDIRQLAKAIASGAEFFVTRDEALLGIAGAVREAFPIQVIRPSQLLTAIDAEDREGLYAPTRLFGTEITSRFAHQEDLERNMDAFLGRKPQEAVQSYRDLTRQIAASCAARYGRELQLVCDNSKAPILARCRHLSDSEVIDIEFLRSAPHPLAPTAVRHFLLEEIQRAAESKRNLVRVIDPHISAVVQLALTELGFVRKENGWERHLCSLVISAGDASNWPSILRQQNHLGTDVSFALDLERRFWPLKVSGAGIECGTLTIKSHWAAKLFDPGLAGQELFPVDPSRVFNRENVFYRSHRGWPKTSPRRVLWYISGTNSFRACSTVISVEVGSAKELYRRFSRLGIYQWPEVLATAGGDPFGKLMAVHFSDTEVFPRPVFLSETKEFGVGKMVAGPQPISEENFMKIYCRGKKHQTPFE